MQTTNDTDAWIDLKIALKILTVKQCLALILVKYLYFTQADASEIMGVSQQRISQLIDTARLKLREALVKQG